ncbi:MAG: UDP-N-acetylmuramoyl-L-alanyl-D-glutamate--2,6-diaminopimelate ligase [Thalassolituus oleivorans]|nr:UDP-N-acetylmuramoyl-L-alanyl-D-glutamate--2,6-diaminopimelate ligase [Thalassolituus oleivorans]
MKLSAIAAPHLFIPPEWDREINHIVIDSRDVKQGDLFIARVGRDNHGERFIETAIQAGASAVVALGEPGFRCGILGVPIFSTPDLLDHLSDWLHRAYAGVSQLDLTAVTGTNGKSSVTQYIAQLLTQMKIECGLLGTLGNGIWPNLAETRNTTADLSVVLRHLNDMAEQSIKYAALEVSSHGIDQRRIDGIHFKVAVLTNLTRDHLDYHGSMEAYFEAKRRLFVGGNIGAALINIDDGYGRRLAADKDITVPVFTYGRSDKAEVRYHNVELNARGMTATLTTPWGEADIVLPLIGEFNLANATAAIAVLAIQGFPFESLVAAASTLQSVAGRMEVYVKDNAPLAIVDFAHTPDALDNVLNALKPWNKAISLVFGCGGERDRTKRPIMAVIAQAHADQVWLTDDNPRGENSDQIFSDVLAADGSDNFYCIHDRRKAIEGALEKTDKDSIVVITGKGHEAYQEVSGTRHAYSDAGVLMAQGYRKAGEDYVA